ncbi:MAG TPA: GNAT family N-acetyltransferase [Acidimicrobiia bacterium]
MGPLQIVLKPVVDFSNEETTALHVMKSAVYPDRTPEIEANRAREWDRPQWGVFVTDQSGALVSYTGVVMRSGAVDGQDVVIGGVGGIATHPDHRGKGYAPLGMGRALDFLLENGAAFGLLVCRDELVGYYTRLGWRLFEGTTLNTQRGEQEVFTFNNVMVGDLNSTAPAAGVIDLRGPAW